MNELKLVEISYEIGISGIGEINTISNGADNGANNNLACGFWNSMRHSTTEQAVNNFLSRLPASNSIDNQIQGSGALNIGGHGSEGFLTSGSGHGPQDWQKNFIANWNQVAWGPFLEKLSQRNFPWLKIWSCHTGAGEEGAALLYAIAKVIKKPVMANTGFLFSNNKCRIWQENGAVWQVATPENRPAPISAPSPHFQEYEIMSDIITLGSNSIKSSEIKNINLVFNSHLVNKEELVIDDNEIIKIITKEIISGSKIKIPGKPLAFINAQIRIRDIRENEILINIYNNKLATNEAENIGFYLSPKLSSLLKSLSGEN